MYKMIACFLKAWYDVLVLYLRLGRIITGGIKYEEKF